MQNRDSFAAGLELDDEPDIGHQLARRLGLFSLGGPSPGEGPRPDVTALSARWRRAIYRAGHGESNAAKGAVRTLVGIGPLTEGQ